MTLVTVERMASSCCSCGGDGQLMLLVLQHLCKFPEALHRRPENVLNVLLFEAAFWK